MTDKTLTAGDLKRLLADVADQAEVLIDVDIGGRIMTVAIDPDGIGFGSGGSFVFSIWVDPR